MNLAYSQGGLKLEINIPPQHISAKSKGGLIIEGGVISSEYGIMLLISMFKDTAKHNLLKKKHCNFLYNIIICYDLWFFW